MQGNNYEGTIFNKPLSLANAPPAPLRLLLCFVQISRVLLCLFSLPFSRQKNIREKKSLN